MAIDVTFLEEGGQTPAEVAALLAEFIAAAHTTLHVAVYDYRMIGALTRSGVTIVSTVEVTEAFSDLALSPYAISFLSDDIIRMRYVEIGGQLRKVLMVVKLRAGDHSKDIREYEITPEGLRIGQRLTGYHGLITGVPEPIDPGGREGGAAPGPPDRTG